MPTSGTPRANSAHRGFTLLELVVVLGLLGLATALVAPAGIRTIETWRRATDVDAALGGLSALGSHARETGAALTLAEGDVPVDAVPGLPEGWSVVLQEPLQVQANGACAAGSRGVLLHRSGYSLAFSVTAPFCEAVRQDPGTG